MKSAEQGGARTGIGKRWAGHVTRRPSLKRLSDMQVQLFEWENSNFSKTVH